MYIYSNATWYWLQPYCAAELNAMGTDYDPQFSHLNVTWPEKYPFLPIKSPWISPFAEKTCWSSLIWKVYWYTLDLNISYCSTVSNVLLNLENKNRLIQRQRPFIWYGKKRVITRIRTKKIQELGTESFFGTTIIYVMYLPKFRTYFPQIEKEGKRRKNIGEVYIHYKWTFEDLTLEKKVNLRSND